ncbi:hypothetical protein BDK92_2728 [Micromonospora pisi]|uniref:Uncharacterized protein n=1 Tax=Micromonospora pisi TaxID=589240 RepID=A0A495JI29_9ACTN|nr:hypothetical protein [Micromonospora pisi]RKR88405.1 hypothetical protein BDK92_2728 [Micromonospora pisi]
MPRHPDAIITPNTLLSDARKSLASPNRRDQHLSRAELADVVNSTLERLHPDEDMTAQYVDFRWVGKLERGEHRWPSDERRAALRHVLKAASDARLGLYSPRRSPAATQQPVPLSAQPSTPGTGIRVDDELISSQPDAVEAWLRELDRLTLQATPAVTPQLGMRVRQHLEVLDWLQRDGARPYLASVDARWSEFMSWVADNAGEPDGGSWLDRSHRRAAEADDQLLGAYSLMRQSQRALADGDVRAAITLSRRSLTHGPVPPRTRVLCLTRMAEGLAASGDDDAPTVITAARRGLRRAANDTEDEFARHCDLRYVAAVDARCRQLLGDSISAVRIFEDLLDGEHAVPLLDVGMWHAHLGECYLFGDPERAAAHGMNALRLAREAGAYRVIRATQPLAIALRWHSALAPVRAFVDAHRGAVTGR